MLVRAPSLVAQWGLVPGVAEATIAAGRLVQSMQTPALAVDRKAGDEPVTAADRAASTLLVDAITAQFPHDVVISEETADDPRRLTNERVWFIDPIDGTNDFIRGETGFCVMVGMCQRGRPVAGYVYHPPSERLYVAAHGRGAWIVSLDEEPARMRVSTVDELPLARMVVSKSHRTATIDDVKSALGISSEINVGSVGLKLALIAVGERDLYVNPNTRTKAWDTCAPEVLLHEAGGRLTAVDGTPLEYRAAALGHPRGLVATNGHLHEAAIAKMGPLFEMKQRW